MSKPKNKPQDTEITRVTQEDFLAQLARILREFDSDGDGLLTDDEWDQVAKEASFKSAS